MIIGNRYELGNPLGEGGMGTVFRGTDLQTGQSVAIKRLKPELAGESELLARFASEAEALRVLNHPNIVKVLATLHEDGQQYLVMEYVSGGSLYELMRDHAPLPVSHVLQIALDLSDALIRAHRLNIIHRDLKPANVLLAEDGIPRLTDFGVARVGTTNRVTETGVTVGTLDYLSPEALRGEDVDARTDIWAFGVMLYEMLAGQRPFAGDSVGHIVTAILSSPTPDLEALRADLPIALIDLVYRMLEKDRWQRIPSARQVGAELEAIIHGHAITPAPILTVRDQEVRSPVTPTPVPEGPKHNLPVQPTPFVGREQELAAISKLFADPSTHLVTILGPGGMGKTRLALEVAGRYVSGTDGTFANGVYFVPLAPITAPEFIVPTIAEALRFSFYEADDPAKQLIDYLREKHLLLVIDNFEHVIAGATLVADILKAAPGVRVLATSRERLNLQGENLFPIGGMEFPDWEAPGNTLEHSAVKLFLQSARRAQPGFELQDGELKYLARICKLVRGMPLAIELAAAWADNLRLDEIATEIGRSMDFLETEMRDVPERHRSIRAVFEYSWALLSEDERHVFMKLSIFRGGCTRDAAMAVAGASLRALTALVNKSLLSRDTTGRYHVHELLRQYAEDRLRESGLADAAYEAHGVYFADYYGGIFQDMSKMGDPQAIKQIEGDIENVRAAWNWGVDHARSMQLSGLVMASLIFYQVRSLYLEAAEMLDKAVCVLDTLPSTPEISLALEEVLLAQGWFLIRLGEIVKARTALERSCELMKIIPPPRGREEPLSALGMVHSILGDYQTALRLAEEGLKFNLSRNDIFSSMISYYSLTSAAYGQGDYQAAKQYSQQGLAAAEKGNQSWFAAYIHVDLGNIARVMGDYVEAKKHYEACYTIRKEYGDPEGMALSLRNLGATALLEGDPAKAKSLYEESIVLYKDMGDRGGLATALTGLGTATSALADYPSAKRYLIQALKLTNEIRLTPLILTTLVSFGRMLLKSGQQERGLEILGLAQNHPACTPESKDEIKTILAQCGPTNPAALERGIGLDLDTMVGQLLVS